MMAAMILLCGILTGIGIFLVVLKQEKLPEQKPEKVKQELQKKSEETLEGSKAETRGNRARKGSRRTSGGTTFYGAFRVK